MRSRSLGTVWFVLSLGVALPLARAQQFVDTLPLPSAGSVGRYLPPTDIDGDGDVDFVAITPAGVRLFRNDGVNRFGAGVIVDPLLGTLASAVADFDGDGDGDIAVLTPVSASSTTTLYLLRNGGSTFTTSAVHQPTTVTIEPMWLQPLDIDGDGDLDLLAALGQGPSVIYSTALLVLENDGTGQFSDVTANWLAPPGPVLVSYIGAKVLDVDADGRTDVLLYRQPLRLLRNTGTQLVDETATRLPQMPQALSAASVGDIDGDGDPDLLVLQDGLPPRLLMNFAGVFGDVTPFLLAPLAAVEQAAFLDFDRDGDQDLFVRGGSPATAQVVTNSGGGTLLTVQPAPDFVERPGVSQPTRYAMHRCDLEGDGDDDLVLPYEYLGVLRGDGRGSLADPWAATRLGGSSTLDADGDGDADVLTSAGLAINDGFSGFTTVPYTGATPPVAGAIADFDNDGDDDVGGATAIYLSNGGGSFTAVPFTAGGGLGQVAFDFDADGNADLLNLPISSPPRLFRNLGGGAMVLAQAFPSGAAFYGDAADVDGDGDLDLVLSGGISAVAVRLWLQSAPGVFVVGATAQLGGRAVFARIVGSGAPDVVVANGPSPVMLRIVGGAFVDVTASTLPTGFSGAELHAADVDGDGDVDLVGDQLLRNDGTGVLALEPLDLLATPRRLRDLDGDGDLDLIVGTGTRMFACWNREHHLDVPLPAATGRSLRLDVSALPGRASALELAVVGVGLTRSAPGIATPFGELRLGAIGLTLALQITPVTGSGTLSLPIPNQAALVGIDLHFQTLHIGPAGWQLANLASTRIE